MVIEHRIKVLHGIILALILLWGFTPEALSSEAGSFQLSSWKVGQYVEYQIIEIENSGVDNRYHLSIEGKENIEEKEFFWVKLKISEKGKKQLVFKILCEPFNQLQFAKKPHTYIAEGILVLMKNARKIILDIGDGNNYEIAKEGFFNKSSILDDALFETLPDQKNKIDFSKMTIFPQTEIINTPDGAMDCYHFQVKTSPSDVLTDEGIDLWRSPLIPFLGIVKMEFSKSRFREKMLNQYNIIMASPNWLDKIYAYFFLRRVPGREGNDMFVMNLINYGEINEK